MKITPRIAIIGAGIAGLVCAYELKKAGQDVTVFEADSTVGGRMRSREKDGLIFDIGATHLIPNYTNMLEYVDELNLDWMPMDFCSYGIFKNGSIKPVHKTLSLKSNLVLANTYRKMSEDADFRDLETAMEYNTDNAYDYAITHLNQEIADYIVDPFTAAYQFHRATEASAAAFVAVMQSVKKDKTAWDLHRIAGGMSVLPEALAKHLDVRTNTPVHSITLQGDMWTVQTERDAEQYDTVVLATTAPISNQILKKKTPIQQQLLEQTEYASSVSVAFQVAADSLPKTSITWIPYVQNTKFSGISNEVMKGDDLRSNGKQLLCTWLHDGYAQEMLTKSDDEIWKAVLEEFPKVCPWVSKDDLTPHDLQRWTHAMPKFNQELLTNAHEFLTHEQGQRNVWLCGDYLNSPWTEGALWNGKRVATGIIESLS